MGLKGSGGPDKKVFRKFNVAMSVLPKTPLGAGEIVGGCGGMGKVKRRGRGRRTTSASTVCKNLVHSIRSLTGDLLGPHREAVVGTICKATREGATDGTGRLLQL